MKSLTRRLIESLSVLTLAVLAIFMASPNRLKVVSAQETPKDVQSIAKLVKINDEDLRVFIDGDFFAEYRADYKGTPIIWPICGPNRSLATRAWPMIDDVDVNSEKDPVMKTIYENAVISERNGDKDHPHHRSFWFNHGSVNNEDFWGLGDSEIRQIKLVSASEEGQTVKIVTENRWRPAKLDRDVCADLRTVVFGAIPELPSVRYIDFSITITALENNVVFGDTKEGSFGIRVPSPTALTSKKKSTKWGGTILDNAGNRDGATWAKQTAWVNYVGPVEKYLEGAELKEEYEKAPKNDDFPLATIGIAVLNGSNSLGIVPWRHVREYGLFASNPFGQRDFEPKNPKADGSKTLNKGDSMIFNFRVLFHDGSLSSEDLDKAYEQYRNELR